MTVHESQMTTPVSRLSTAAARAPGFVMEALQTSK